MWPDKDCLKKRPTELMVARKTSRPSLSAVDLFHASVTWLLQYQSEGVTDFDLTIREYLYHQPLVELTPGVGELANSRAALRCIRDKEPWTLSFFEGTRVAEHTYEFNEAQLRARFTTRGRRIEFTGPLPCSPVQIFATASKVLLLNTFKDEVREPILVRVIMSAYDPTPAQLSCGVELRYDTPKDFNLSTIFLGDRKAGQMHWILK
ncbi:MAG: hypothetical protein AB7F86_07900 [Bdellovibrionales bacterium]